MSILIVSPLPLEKSTESADETGSPKKGKKSGGKKKSKTKLTDKSTTSESELDQPIDKKGTKKKHKKQKGAVTLDYPIGDADSDESHASETKRKRKRAKKTVSWISPHERKLMGRSTSGLITKKSSSELKSRGEVISFFNFSFPLYYEFPIVRGGGFDDVDTIVR